MFDPRESASAEWDHARRESITGGQCTPAMSRVGTERVEKESVVDEIRTTNEPPVPVAGSEEPEDPKDARRKAGDWYGCPTCEPNQRDGIAGDFQTSDGSWIIEPLINVSTGLPVSAAHPARRALGQPVVGLRSVKQDWVGGRSSSEPCRCNRTGGADSEPDGGACYVCDPIGARRPTGDQGVCVSVTEDLLVAELHLLWLAQRPAWVDPCWYDAHIRPPVRALLLLAPGPELLAAVSEVGSGPCRASHRGEGFPSFPTIGSEPGFACDCQLVVAAAWHACDSWVQAQATRSLVDIMGEDPVVIPADGLAPGTVDPGREEAALVLRYNPRSFANRVDTARDIEAHPELVELAEFGACSFWTVRLLASDLSDLTEEQAREVTGELIGKVNQRIHTGARPWTGNQIRAAAKRLIARVCPNDQAGSRAKAWQGRRVQVWPRDHGMSLLAATISDTDAHRILRRLTKQAAQLGDPERTQDQKRADILADTLLASPGLQPPDASRAGGVTMSAAALAAVATGADNYSGRASGVRADVPAGPASSPTSLTPPVGPTSPAAGAVPPTFLTPPVGPAPLTPPAAGAVPPASLTAPVGSTSPAAGAVPPASLTPTARPTPPAAGAVPPASLTASVGPAPLTPSVGPASPAAGAVPPTSLTPPVGSTAPAAGAVPPRAASGAAEVCVVVKLETLLGLADDSAEIPGLGPIPADTARELAADGKWRAWITNSAGTITATSSSTYRPSAALARLIRAREPYCRMPGCRTPASRCDLDHAIAWPMGKTTIENLGPLCRRHHVLKTHYGWRLEPEPSSPPDLTSPPRAALVPDDASQPGATPRPGPDVEPDSPGSGFPGTRDGDQAPDPWERSPGWSWETPNGKIIQGDPLPPF